MQSEAIRAINAEDSLYLIAYIWPAHRHPKEEVLAVGDAPQRAAGVVGPGLEQRDAVRTAARVCKARRPRINRPAHANNAQG